MVDDDTDDRKVYARAPASARTASDSVEHELLRAAGGLLAEGGVDALSVRAVAAAARVAPMGVYSRFGGKDGLVDALAIRALQAFSAAVFDGQDPSPRTLQAAARAYRDWALANPHLYRMAFSERSVLRGSPAPVAEAGRAFFGRLVDLLADAPGQHGGPSGVVVEAQVVFACLHGAVSLELDGLVQADPQEAFEVLLGHLPAVREADRRVDPPARPDDDSWTAGRS